MRVCDSARVLFVHVEKTGGSTIDTMLDEEVGDCRALPDLARHAPLPRIVKYEPRLLHYWTFGFVRNPWARMVSWWAMVQDVIGRADAGDPAADQRMRDNPVFWKPARTWDSFETFLRIGPEQLLRLRRPQLDMLQVGRRRADFIGRQETFALDLAAVRARLELPPLQQVPQHNATPHADYRDYYTPALRDLVATAFAKDVAAFGYEF